LFGKLLNLPWARSTGLLILFSAITFNSLIKATTDFGLFEVKPYTFSLNLLAVC